MGAQRGTPPVHRGTLVRSSSELSAPILKSLGILESRDLEHERPVFFSGIGSGAPEIQRPSRERSQKKIQGVHVRDLYFPKCPNFLKSVH